MPTLPQPSGRPGTASEGQTTQGSDEQMMDDSQPDSSEQRGMAQKRAVSTSEMVVRGQGIGSEAFHDISTSQSNRTDGESDDEPPAGNYTDDDHGEISAVLAEALLYGLDHPKFPVGPVRCRHPLLAFLPALV